MMKMASPPRPVDGELEAGFELDELALESGGRVYVERQTVEGT